MKPMPSQLAGLILVALLSVIPAAAEARGSQERPPERAPAQAPEQAEGLVGERPDDLDQGLPTPPGLDPVEVVAFVDGLMSAYLEAYDTAGATVSVVQGDRLLLAKGYGWANVAERRPVDAESTLFRIGSISKLFTWISVMQLVEQGRLDLDADVNTWLSDFRIPETWDEPITLEHLMTHTAGFEDRVIGLFGRDEDSLAPLGEILAAQLPVRVRPPGEVSSYSNHGTGIAAYIVEQVTGVPFADYVEDNILQPLGMRRTTFRQPPPGPLQDDLSAGYRYTEEIFRPQGFEFVPLAPVGAASTTATDMARFMRANLADGALEGRRILQPETMRRMRSAVFRHAPQVNPMGYGYLDVSLGGQWIVGHGGDTIWFHSVMALLPEHDIGFFVSVNTDAGAAIGLPFTEAFVKEFFPADPVEVPEPPPDFGDRAGRYTGYYRANRYAHTTLAKLGALGAVEVTAVDDTLRLSATGAQPWIEVDDVRRFGAAEREDGWEEAEPLVFRNALDGDILAFRENDDGEITHMFLGPLQIAAFERLEGVDTPPFQLGVFAFTTGVFLLTLLLWPVAALVRRRFDVHRLREDRLPLGARLCGWVASLLFLLFLALAVASLSDPMEIVYGVPAMLETTLWLPLVAIPFSVGALLYAISVWRRRRAGAWTRVWYTILVLACFVALWQLHYWNLLGFRY